MKLETSADFIEMTTALPQLFGTANKDRVALRLLLASTQAAHLQRLQQASAMLACEILIARTSEEMHAHLQQTAFDLIVLAPPFTSHAIDEFRSILSCPQIWLSAGAAEQAALAGTPLPRCAVLNEDAPAAAWRKAMCALLGGQDAKRESQALRRRLEDIERLFAYLVQESPDLVFILNSQGEFVFLNERAGDCSATAAPNWPASTFQLSCMRKTWKRRATCSMKSAPVPAARVTRNCA